MSSLYLISWLSQSPLEKQKKTEAGKQQQQGLKLPRESANSLKHTKKETSPEQQMR